MEEAILTVRPNLHPLVRKKDEGGKGASGGYGGDGGGGGSGQLIEG
jgi:hypothetical protein